MLCSSFASEDQVIELRSKVIDLGILSIDFCDRSLVQRGDVCPQDPILLFHSVLSLPQLVHFLFQFAILLLYRRKLLLDDGLVKQVEVVH